MSKFVKDIFINSTTRALQIVLGIGTSIIVARCLGPEKKGIHALVLMFPALLIMLVDIGIGSAAVFYIGKMKYPLKQVLGGAISMALACGAVAIILGICCIGLFSDIIFRGVPEKYLYLMLCQLPIALVLSFVTYVLLGVQKIRAFSFIQLSTTFNYLVMLVGLLVFGLLDIGTAVSVQIASYLVACIVSLVVAVRTTGGVCWTIPWPLYKDLMTYGVKNYLGNMFSFLQYKIDVLIINLFLSPFQVGCYAIAVALTEQTWLFADSASTVLFPKVASERDEVALKRRTAMVVRNIVFIMLVVAVVLFMIGPHLITYVYSNNYINSVMPFQLLLPGIIAISGWRVLANDLAGRGMPMLNTWITGSAVIFNVVMNILLIPRIGINGAAIATSMTYALAFVICLTVYCRKSGNKFVDVLILKRSDLQNFSRYIGYAIGRCARLVRAYGA